MDNNSKRPSGADEEPTVVFKGRRDGVTIWLSDKPEYNELRESLRVKAREARGFFQDAKVDVSFTGKKMSDNEINELKKILAEETDMTLSFGEVPEIKARTVHNTQAAAEDEHMTIYHMGALRSGQIIRYEGSVVVLGDVNPGSEIIASKNIIVLGLLKGMAHAGCAGDTSSYISALQMSPVQLRICDIITYIPEDKKSDRRKNHIPSYAYIQDGQIFIAPLIETENSGDAKEKRKPFFWRRSKETR